MWGCREREVIKWEMWKVKEKEEHQERNEKGNKYDRKTETKNQIKGRNHLYTKPGTDTG